MKQFTPFFVLALFLSFSNRSNSQFIFSGISNLEIVPTTISGTGKSCLTLNAYQEIYRSIAPNAACNLPGMIPFDRAVVSDTNLPAGGLKRASISFR